MSEIAGGGPAKRVISFKPGQGFQWRGMMPDLNPQDQPPNSPRQILNMRRIGGRFEQRPGRDAVAGLGASHSITGMVDHEIATPRSLMVTGDGCPGVSTTIGFYLAAYDTEQDPRFQRVTYYPTTTNPVSIATYGDQFYFSVDNTFRRLQSIRPPYGLEMIDIGGIGQEVSMWTLPTGYDYVSSMAEHEGSLIICAVGTVPAASAIFNWDGTTFTNELSPTSPMTAFGEFRDTLIGGFETASGIRVRASDGTWGALITPGAGTANWPVAHSSASYRDRFYFPNRDEDIFVFDGTTLTRIPRATTGVTAGSHIVSVETAFGYLWYLWWDSVGNKLRVGKYDGTTWTASHKSLDAQFTVTNIPTQGRAMRLYRGALMVAGTTTGGAGVIYESPLEDVDGIWAAITLGATDVGIINELVVF